MNKGRLRQIHAALAGGFAMLVMGALNVWPSYTSEYYSSNVTTPLSHPMTKTEEALLGSLPSLGAMLGTAVSGPLINALGRRNGGVLMSLPFAISWALVGVTSSITVVLAARFLAGIAGGGFLVLAPIFVSEVVEDSIRGALASSSIFLYCMGTLLSYLCGWFLSYRYIIGANLVLSVICTLLILLVVESPVYLLKQHREEDARQAIALYRSVSVTSPVVLDEMTRLKHQILPAVELISITESDSKAEEAEKQKLNGEGVVQDEVKGMSTVKLLFTSPVSRRAFIAVWSVMTMQVLMGIVPVQVYAKSVFRETDPGRADMYTVLFALVQFAGSVVTGAVADRAGRRVLLISSSVMVLLCSSILGVLLQTKLAPGWVTVVLLLAYCFCFMFGAGSVPYVLIAEVFITEVQSLASMLIIEWVWFLNFFFIGVFPLLTSSLGISAVFYLFATMSLGNAVIAYFIIPETKGLSNQQIQDVFRSRKKN